MSLDVMSYPPKPGMAIPGTDLKLIKRCGGGEKGIAYIASDSTGNQVVVKFPNLDGIAHELKKDFLAEIASANEREKSAWAELKDLPNVSHFIATIPIRLDLGFKTPCDFLLPVMNFIPGARLEDWTRDWSHENGKPKFSGLPFKHWLRFAQKILQLIESVHLRKIVHGDIHPRNILVSSSKDDFTDLVVSLIDFGSSSSLEYPGEPASQKEHLYIFRAPERIYSVGKQREKNYHPPRWYAPVDLYSIGMVLLYMAIGEALIESWPVCRTYGFFLSDTPGAESDLIDFRSPVSIKDEIIEQIASVNGYFLNEGTGTVDVIMSCIRPKLDDRCKTATEVLKQLDIFDRALNPASVKEALQNKYLTLDIELKKIIEECANPILLTLLFDRLADFNSDCRTASANHIAAWKDRNSAINDLLSAMSICRAGDECIALTTITFWRAGAGGPNGRVLSMLKRMALRGVSVSWIIVRKSGLQAVSANEQSEQVEILKYQLKAAEEVLRILNGRPRSEENGERNDSSGQYSVSICDLNEHEYEALIRERKTFISLRCSGVDTFCIPDYSEVGGTLAVARFWHNPERASFLRKCFSSFLSHPSTKCVTMAI